MVIGLSFTEVNKLIRCCTLNTASLGQETRLGRVLAYGFPLTEFGGFHGPSSANSKLFHGSEFQLVKDRGNNKNSSSIV